MERSPTRAAWLFPFALLVLAIIFVPLRVLDPEGLPRYQMLHTELLEVEANNARMRQEVEQLTQRVDGLKHSPAAIERIARDELGMVRDREIIFQFPQ